MDKFPHAPIVVSQASLFEWAGSLLLEPMIRSLFRGRRAIDGFELCTHSEEELYDWCLRLERDSCALPNSFSHLSERCRSNIVTSRFLSLHLPSLKDVVDVSRFARAVELVRKKLGISEFTIHPDETTLSRWSELLNKTGDEIHYSVENMDTRTLQYGPLYEIAAILESFPRLSCTFDMCHWLERGQDILELNSFLAGYSNRISKVHYSVPRSEALFYRKYSGINHHAVFRSEWRLVPALSAILDGTYPLVCEGFIPLGSTRALKGEIELAHMIIAQFHNTKKVA